MSEAVQPIGGPDRELWREKSGDFYSDSIHVTSGGRIGINCGGMVIVAPLKQWHTAIQERDSLQKRVEELGEQVQIGVIEFHTKKNAELRDEFYEVVDDLRNAGSIVDVWLLDIGAVLKKHGYALKIYQNATPKESQ